MQEILEEIWKQIHDIRNLCAPFEFKLALLEEHITELRGLGNRMGGVESLLQAHTLKLEEQGLEIATLLERLDWIEPAVKALLKAVHPESFSSSSHDDKGRIATLP